MQRSCLRLLAWFGVLLLPAAIRADSAAAMNPIAEAYVKLALAAGVHDGDFVDAYNRPPEWKTAAETAKPAEPFCRGACSTTGGGGGSGFGSGADNSVERCRHQASISSE